MVVNHHGDKPILNSGRIKLEVTFICQYWPKTAGYMKIDFAYLEVFSAKYKRLYSMYKSSCLKGLNMAGTLKGVYDKSRPYQTVAL